MFKQILQGNNQLKKLSNKLLLTWQLYVSKTYTLKKRVSKIGIHRNMKND